MQSKLQQKGSVEVTGDYCKWLCSDEILPMPDRVNRHFSDPSTTLLFKLVLEVVKDHTSYLHNSDGLHLERPSPLKGGQVAADRHQ